MQAVSLVGCDSLFICELIILHVQYSIAVQFGMLVVSELISDAMANKSLSFRRSLMVLLCYPSRGIEEPQRPEKSKEDAYLLFLVRFSRL